MSRRIFTLFNLIGGLSWAVAVAALDFGAGAAYDHVLHTMSHVGTIALLAALAIAAMVAMVQCGRSRAMVIQER